MGFFDFLSKELDADREKSKNFTWKEAKATGVKLRSTDKLKIIAATETASGAWRFHLDDILIVAE